MFVGKLLISGEFLTVFDHTFLVLFALHILTFLTLFSLLDSDHLQPIRSNVYRKLAQETFKGYGKGLSLTSFAFKGLQQEIYLPYFLFVIAVRSIISATFKDIYLGCLKWKKPKFKKVSRNFRINGVSTMILYLFMMINQYLPRGH